jgi:hypothetical protein
LGYWPLRQPIPAELLAIFEELGLGMHVPTPSGNRDQQSGGNAAFSNLSDHSPNVCYK